MACDGVHRRRDVVPGPVVQMMVPLLEIRHRRDAPLDAGVDMVPVSGDDDVAGRDACGKFELERHAHVVRFEREPVRPGKMRDDGDPDAEPFEPVGVLENHLYTAAYVDMGQHVDDMDSVFPPAAAFQDLFARESHPL